MEQQDRFRIVQMEREMFALRQTVLRVLAVQAISLMIDLGLVLGLAAYFLTR